MGWSTPPTRRSYACRGDYVKSLRERRGWTQEKFATVAGYSPRLIRKVESSASLNPETIADIAEALSTSETPIFPEDLVSDPEGAARLFVESYDRHEVDLLAHCRHILAEDLVFWCAGAGLGCPFGKEFHGLNEFQEFWTSFFSVVVRPKLRPLMPTFALAGNEVVARMVEYPIINGVEGPPIWIVHVMKFRRGKIARMENYFDTLVGEQVLSQGGYGKF
jgi:transcriptional regulator with XRE-family HTH domain